MTGVGYVVGFVVGVVWQRQNSTPPSPLSTLPWNETVVRRVLADPVVAEFAQDVAYVARASDDFDYDPDFYEDGDIDFIGVMSELVSKKYGGPLRHGCGLCTGTVPVDTDSWGAESFQVPD